MKSTDVYSLLKSELAPWFKSAGFKRTKEFLGWFRPCSEGFTVAWCQVSQDGWDPYAGSKFVVEFQRSPESMIGGSGATRKRIGKLLSQVEREEVRRMQNAVIAGLRPPPASHPFLQNSSEIAEWYLNKFEVVGEPYLEGDDIWFRYTTAQDVVAWARFILAKLPGCIASIENSAVNGSDAAPPIY